MTKPDNLSPPVGMALRHTAIAGGDRNLLSPPYKRLTFNRLRRYQFFAASGEACV